MDTDTEIKATIVDIDDAIIEIEIGSTPYRVREMEARALRDSAKSYEKTNPIKAIDMYKKCIEKLVEVDNLVRKTHAFKILFGNLGTLRTMSFPVERITALLEKNCIYSQCLYEITTYENMVDPKGLSKTDANLISKRKSRIIEILKNS